MEPIAIIGIGCRFPKANDPESFWQLLRNGVDAISEVPKDRWNIDQFYDPEPAKPGKMNTRWGGFLDQVDQFDPSFFGISPREAERMDPQQRLVLEVAWESLENAGIVPSTLSGSQTGVFIAIGNYDYCRLLGKDLTRVNAYDGTGNTLCIAANRLSYILNLRGPSVVIETACSSSLVALHFACQSLQSAESNLCLVGGVSLILSPEPTITYSHARMMAADGRCKTFDASADGYVRGEGCGVVVLKRLSDALMDRDNILAIVKGSAVNQDGLSNGLTAPNGPSQQAVIRQALQNARVAPAQISYVEAHGTGTSLGDPIEVKSLKAVLMQGRKSDQRCWIGSVKTNIGHLEAASGIASLIKVVLALQHQEIPPHLHLNQLNPYISLTETTFSIPTDCQPWSVGTECRLAGVSAFGFGGTNCHAILEAAPKPVLCANHTERPIHLLTLSAKSEGALRQLAQRYADFLTTHPEVSLADVCFTANTGRSHFDHRLAVVAGSTAQLHEQLAAFGSKQVDAMLSDRVQSKHPSKIAFLFTQNLGSQYIGMGRQLYETQPTFRSILDRCAVILHPYLAQPLLGVLYPAPGMTPLDESTYTQPALFALEYALCQLWKSWGIEPAVVMGYGVGEYVAACVAGVFSLEDGLKMIAEWGRSIQVAQTDGMGAVSVDKVRMAFEQVAREVVYSPPQIGLISNATGKFATDEITTPEYWCHYVQQPAKFSLGMETLQQQGYKVFVELGPQPNLSDGQYCLPEGVGVWLPSLAQGQNDWQQLLKSLATLYTLGVPVEWSSFDRDYPRCRLQLPTYPFRRQRYWPEIAEEPEHQAGDLSSEQVQTPIVNLLNQGNTKELVQHLAKAVKLQADELKLLPKLVEVLVGQNQQQLTASSIADWVYELEWLPLPRQLTTSAASGLSEAGNWMILADVGGVGQTLAELLRQRGHNCILVYAGDVYQTKETGTWSINPSSPSDFERLLQEAACIDLPLQGVVHLWSLEAGLVDELTISSLEPAQVLGVGSVLHLLQALVKQNELAPPRLWLVTRGAMPVGLSLPSVAQAPLWGMGKVIALEHPEFWGGMLDLAPEATEDEATKLLAEIRDSQGEDHLAFRDEHRYVARLVRRQLPREVSELPLRSDGTYLITGGLGTLGLLVAQWLVEQGVRQLVLTGRHGVSTFQVQDTLTQMQQAGAKVLVVQADVSSAEDMVRVLETVRASMPPLRGIVHAAGIPGYQAIKDLDLNTFASVLRPKVVGTWILHQLTQEMNLDFFVSFSSIASVWGSKGQAHYAAANHFLDVLAHYRQGLGLPALSVNWGPWAGGGMAVPEFQMWLSRMGVAGLQPKQAIAALGYLLGAGCVQTTVAGIDWSLFKGLYEARGKRSLLEQIEVQQGPAEQQPAQRSEILQQFETATETERHSLLTAYLQREVAKLLGLSQLPEPQTSLFNVGMDSLMAIDLVSLIRSQLQLELPMTEFLQASNIALLTALVLKKLTPSVASTNVVEVLNLNEEAVLDDSIHPHLAHAERTETSAILVTGTTGFLGAFLLQELLKQTEAKIYCLVRTSNASLGMQKIKNNLKSYYLWEEQYHSRIIPVIGNLSQPLLGLSVEQFEKMASLIDVIYHNGAILNFVYPYSALKPTNVLGTQEILRLACQFKIKPVHYISTDAVFDSSSYYGKEVRESDPVIHTEGIDLGYTQSKWVAEKLVTIARDRGIPVSIYRPPLIAGDSQTGIWNTDDFTCRFIKGCIQMGSMPNMNCGITIVPVDYVSRAIVYLSRQQECLGKAFHLNNPNSSSWSYVANWIDTFGYPIRQIDYEAWEAELSGINSEDNVLSSLLPFFLRRWSEERLTFSGLGQRRARLNCEETVARLAGASITCPPVDAQLLDTYFSSFIRCGFLEVPKQAQCSAKDGSSSVPASA